MTQIKWKAAFLAFLLASSLHSIYTVQAEKGVTTATHIRRHESSTTISTETVKTQVFYNHKGRFHHTPFHRDPRLSG